MPRENAEGAVAEQRHASPAARRDELSTTAPALFSYLLRKASRLFTMKLH